jgi:hypothetical protein
MLAGSVLKPAQIDAAMNEIMGMEKVSDVRRIVDLCVPQR